MKPSEQLQVFITLGNECEAAIGRDDHLYIVQRKNNLVHSVIDLGLFTDEFLENLKGNLDRLSCHTVHPHG